MIIISSFGMKIREMDLGGDEEWEIHVYANAMSIKRNIIITNGDYKVYNTMIRGIIYDDGHCSNCQWRLFCKKDKRHVAKCSQQCELRTE